MGDIKLSEDLYIGNLHQLSTGPQRNNHCWTMFISSSPTDVVVPKTVKSVTWHLHETFNPRRVKVSEPPFYLSRRGWGYFEIRADIHLKREFYPNFGSDSIIVQAAHTLFFGSPLMTHHIQSNMPYLVLSPQLQQLLDTQHDRTSLQSALRRRVAARRVRRQIERHNRRRSAQNQAPEENPDEKSDEKEDEEEEEQDRITKQFASEIVFQDFTLNQQQMRDLLTDMFEDAPICVLDCITEYGALPMKLDSDDLKDSRVVLDGCWFFEMQVASSLEIVIRNCGDCALVTEDVDRMIRVYNSNNVAIKCMGQCTSYRFEQCLECTVDAFEMEKQTVIFMLLLSDKLSFRMYKAELAMSGDSMIRAWRTGKLKGYDVDNECFLVQCKGYDDRGGLFFKVNRISVRKGSSLNDIL